MLREQNIDFGYRDYTEDPLSEAEIRAVLEKLDLEPQAVLRKRDPVFRTLNLTGDETPGQLIRAMAKHPTLLERPIAVRADRAVVGRPAERVLELA